MSQEVGLRIRVDNTLRQEFIVACKANDTTAAQALRAFMRLYVEQNAANLRQGDLFQRSDSKAPPK